MGSFAFFKDFRGRFFCESKYFIKKLQFKQKTILMGIVMKKKILFGIVASALVLGCSDPVKPDADSSSSSGTSATSSSSTKSSSSTALTSSSSGGLNSSSSSGTSITSSSSTKSSSSSGTSITSSSSTNSSSSTALTSSSSDGLNSSSSTAKSSSSVATSSSSQPKSSSSYKTQDDIPFGGRSIYDSIYDPRDDHKYLYKTFTDRHTGFTIQAMAQNLDYAEVITLGAEEQDDDTKVEKYCYNDIPQNCDFYGGLYQWAEMMNLPYECNTISCAHLIQDQHQGICPDGWHLMTIQEMKTVINSSPNGEGIEGVKSQAYWAIGGGRNTSGFTLLGAGMRMADGSFMNLNKTAYWYFPTEKDNNEMRAGGGYISGYDNVFGIDNAYNPKVDGVSARCVMDY
jgi:uncharacterized protein (TIGR02145 family)